MLNIGLLLHFYQPSTQFSETLRKITLRSYEPLLTLFEEFPEAKFTVNLTGSLLDLWEQSGRGDIINRWRAILNQGNIEVVGTAKYHPLLFKLPSGEVERQLLLQEAVLKRLLNLSKPLGFFPPEMGYSRVTAEVISKLGYRWVLLDRSARLGTDFPSTPEVSRETNSIYNLPIKVVFRDPNLSYKIAFAEVRSLKNFKKVIDPLTDQNGHIVLAMDAETFGWHRRTQMNLLRSFLKADKKRASSFKLLNISRIVEDSSLGAELEPLDSTWGFFRETAAGVRVFPRWDNPENPVHNLQWRLLKLAIEASSLEPEGSTARSFLDQGEQSDQFWWASADPCWLPPMVKAGTDLLEKSILSSSRASLEQKKEATRLALEIIDVGQEKFGKKSKRC
ncbi:MAG: Glycoside hydrolase family 57 [Microgenomates group bacterium GW2011_GWA2_44_7]|nr:MAG: Glycoside hydrolase family 57 [Microgenomates group bacterium GW2011_GWA2_44_7]